MPVHAQLQHGCVINFAGWNRCVICRLRVGVCPFRWCISDTVEENVLPFLGIGIHCIDHTGGDQFDEAGSLDRCVLFVGGKVWMSRMNEVHSYRSQWFEKSVYRGLLWEFVCLPFYTAKQDFLIKTCMSGRLRGRVDCFRCISNGVNIGDSEVDISASCFAVSLPGILLCTGVHKNVVVVPELNKVWLSRTILLTVWWRFQFGCWIALSALRLSVMLTALWMWLDEIQYSAWSMP